MEASLVITFSLYSTMRRGTHADNVAETKQLLSFTSLALETFISPFTLQELQSQDLPQPLLC